MGKIHLTDIIGNKSIITQILVAHGAAKAHNKAMGHMMFSGDPGTGKTTSAGAVALLNDAPFFEISAESIKTAESLAEVFAKFPDEGYNPVTGEKVGLIKPPVLFVDEAHRLSLKSQEMLGIAMENFYHTHQVGRGRLKHTVTEWVPEFTLVCATTKAGELSKPFRDRFKFNMIFGRYDFEDSKAIVRLHAKNKALQIDEEAVHEIALRGRGTPRILVRLLDGARDLSTYMKWNPITRKVTDALFELQQIDRLGLEKPDIIILIDLYNAEGPKGLDSMAVKTNLDPKTISEVNEPYLILLGFIERTKGGRIITEAGIDYLIGEKYVEAPDTEARSRVIKRVK